MDRIWFDTSSYTEGSGSLFDMDSISVSTANSGSVNISYLNEYWGDDSEAERGEPINEKTPLLLKRERVVVQGVAAMI